MGVGGIQCQLYQTLVEIQDICMCMCVCGGGGGGGGGDVCMDYRLSARLNFRQDKWCNLNA